MSLQAIPTIAAVILLNFVLLQSLPGDAADVLAGESGSATAESMALLRKHLGVDVPVGQQFLNYLGHHGALEPRLLTAVWNFGGGSDHDSAAGHAVPDAQRLRTCAGDRRFPGICHGLLGAALAGPDSVGTRSSVLYSTPAFWMGLMGIVAFSVHLGWLPSGGEMTLGADLSGWPASVGPGAICDSSPHRTVGARFRRNLRAAHARGNVEVRRQDFVRTAEAKGLHHYE